MKTCTVCKETKPISEFHNRKSSKDGKAYRCKSCDTEARLKWSKNNPEAAHKSQRGRNLKAKYGITLSEYNSMLERQEHKCAICGTSENKVIRGNNATLSFAVDHDHNTGVVRGLLCNQCNRGLGMLGDSVEALKKAIRYLTH